jgi:hypothetical protein
MNLEIHDVKIEYPEGCNIIIGQTHFIKTAEKLLPRTGYKRCGAMGSGSGIPFKGGTLHALSAAPDRSL